LQARPPAKEGEAAWGTSGQIALFFIKLPEYIPSIFCGSLFFGSAFLNNSLTVWLEENMKKAASE
jgi:hypothetical protein